MKSYVYQNLFTYVRLSVRLFTVGTDTSTSHIGFYIHAVVCTSVHCSHRYFHIFLLSSRFRLDLYCRFALQICTTESRHFLYYKSVLRMKFVLQICTTDFVRYLHHKFALQICITDLQCITTFTCGNKKSGSRPKSVVQICNGKHPANL